MRIKLLLLVLVYAAASASARSQERRVYEGVVSVKQETVGTSILIEVNGSSVTGWISLEKFVPIEGGTVTDSGTEFRAAGNTYKIDDKRERIEYSGPDGSGNRLAYRLTAVTGKLDELIEGEQFGSSNIATLDTNGRRKRFNVDDPVLWKRQGPPLEKFRHVEDLLQKDITCWVTDTEDRGDISVIEEPAGMDIPEKAPKKSKDKSRDKDENGERK